MTTDHDGAAPIRTPDQRLRVFVSSTLAELAPERAAVAKAISALRLTPVMFELGARPHPPRELYRAYLAQSDVFVGLYWQRYGWIGPGMDISGLEDEFRLSDGMPRLLYLKSPAPEQEPRLAAMIADIQSAGADSYRSFRSTRELGRLVGDDLALLLSERFATPAPAARLGRAGGGHRDPAAASLVADTVDLVGRSRGRHRRAVVAARVTRRAVGHADGPGRDRQDPTGDRGRRRARRGRAPYGVRAAGVDHRSGARAATRRRRRRRPDRGHALGARHPDRALRADPDAARPRQPRAGDRRGDRARSAPRRVPRRHDPRHEPHRAAPSRRAGVPRRRADGAGVRRAAAARGARRAPRRAPLRRAGAGRAPRLHPGRHERRRRDGDLPAPRRAAAGDRARRGPHAAARTGGAARPTRTRPRRAGHGTRRPPRAPAHPAGDRRVELRAPRRRGARVRGGAVGVRRRLDGRRGRPCRRTHRGRDAGPPRRARRPQPRQRRRRPRRTALPHARDGAGARRRAARRRRRRCRRRAATRRVLRRVRDGRQLAGGTTGRVGRPTRRRGGEPAGRDPLVLHPRHHAAPAHVRRALAVLADARPDDRGSGVDRRAGSPGRLTGRQRQGRGAVHVGGDGGRGRRRHRAPSPRSTPSSGSTDRSTIPTCRARCSWPSPGRCRFATTSTARWWRHPRRSTASAGATNRSWPSPS